MAMTRRAALVDVDRAQVTRHTDGRVVVDDPDSAVLVTVRVGRLRTRWQVTDLQVSARHPHARITTAAVARLPLAQIAHLAARLTPAGRPAGYPNEAHYRALATPKAGPHWDPGHWARVLAVYEWGGEVGWPGGGAQAVAEMWGVTRNPTVYRWLSAARARTAG